MRIPSAPVVSAAVSGFVVGVIVALIATGVIRGNSGNASALPTSTAVAAVDPTYMQARVRHIALHELGPFTNLKQNRIVSVTLLPARFGDAPPAIAGGLTHYQSVNIVFRLNDHPLGPSWRLKAAKADVFGLMKALYTSGLPVYDIQLTGLFGLGKPSIPNTRAVVAYESHGDASKIAWKHWGREFEGALWRRLSYSYVAPKFG